MASRATRGKGKAGSTKSGTAKKGTTGTAKTGKTGRTGKGKTGAGKNPTGNKKPTRPRCKICDKPIYVPDGWTRGPAVRRHYWAKHREVMQGRAKKS